VSIWYILWPFGTLNSYLVYFTKKNLATLLRTPYEVTADGSANSINEISLHKKIRPKLIIEISLF
jgi:hypothetical protein